MTDKIFFITRDHKAGAGEWCIMSTRLDKWGYHIGPRSHATLFCKILNNIDKYPEFETFVSDIIYSENMHFELKDYVPPRNVQGELMDAINSVVSEKESANE
jgi:hypothetical protein